MPADALVPRLKGGPLQNTTIAVVATDAVLSRADAYRLAVAAQTGLARAIYPVHAPLDGDTVFALATGRQPLADHVNGLAELGAYASNTLARAVARAVYAAKGEGSWHERFEI
jgi:L-aminopeptidase/D-esterase-like protein